MTYTPPARPSIRVVRVSPYKGGTREWSQRYFWTGTDFSSGQFAAMKAALKTILLQTLADNSNFTEWIGYDAGSDVPVHTISETAAGTYPISGRRMLPLEVCGLVKLTTTQRSVKNHPIYGFKYFHGVPHSETSNNEAWYDGYKSTLAGKIDLLLAGVSDGDTTRQWCDARGAVFQTKVMSGYLTHRDFPNL